MIEIEIINKQDIKEITEKEIDIINMVIQEAARLENINHGEVSVMLVDENTIQQFNHEYRGIDKGTDVISFAMNEITDDDIEFIFHDTDNISMPNLLGDIIISVSHTLKQAEEYRHSFDREFAFLTLHGFLHLLGYDHQTEDDEKKMFSKQENILNTLNFTR